MLSLLVAAGLVRKGSWLAGGALRAHFSRDEVKDFDLFFSDESYALMAELLLAQLGGECTFRCPAGELSTWRLYGMQIQCVKVRYYHTMEQLVDSFDFTMTMFATDGVTLVTSRRAIRDARDKALNINRVTYPVATLNRMCKFVKRGYRRSPTMLDDLCRGIAGDGYEEQWPEQFRAMYID